ncbi:glycerol-3-phosphate acyltransferase PlsY [Oribacterium sinus]|uniref:Glycerol-3-phosphate acyltransferase n=1 Tax=Oribacterium sinus TaxID=237576 RepID=A0A7W9SFW1_9FIRM|nr:glycerol-3-phosphate 1-O-acyltransferase PlsY [Oribacterium sinus]MBB6041423.1 glycerol-3-phosphate acyltransferase PlsY [Oribacterium sinus]
MSIVQLCVCFILGYIFGNIPNGYLYAKSQGVDIYHQGSGNPGSTNVLRTLGKRAGITVLLMDIAKCMVPIFLMILFWKPANEDQKTLILMLTGIGAILGHNFPILPGVKGGKGVACTGALLIALAPLYTLELLCFFILIVLTTKYVSLGSVLSVFVFFLSVLLMGKSGILFPFSEAIYLPMCGLSLFLALLCLFQHRENMKRLMNGTENKFGKNK